MFPTSAAAAFIIYCIVPDFQHGRVACWPILWLPLLAGPCSTTTPNCVWLLFYGCHGMYIAIVGLHSCCSIIDNNVNTFSIKTIRHHICYQHHYPYQHHVLLLLSPSYTRPRCWRVEVGDILRLPSSLLLQYLLFIDAYFAIACLCSPAKPNTVCDCCFAIAMLLSVCHDCHYHCHCQIASWL